MDPDLFQFLDPFIDRNAVSEKSPYSQHHKIGRLGGAGHVDPAVIGMDLFTCLTFECARCGREPRGAR